MVKLSRAQVIVAVVYALILGHFLYSNFVHVIGPNYLPNSVLDYYLHRKYGDELPIGSCPNAFTPQFPEHKWIESTRGFPFATSYTEYICYQLKQPTENFEITNMDYAFNGAYIVVLSGGAYFLYRRLGHRS
jgi:hypothetical protein